MRFPVEANAADAHRILTEFIALTGIECWTKRTRELESQLAKRPLVHDFFAHRFSIELSMVAALKHRKRAGHFPDSIPDAARYRLLTLAYTATEAHCRLSRTGKSRLEGAIRSALNDSDYGLESLRFELSTAINLMAAGFDVEFSDLENGGGFDFLGRRNGITVEVECKSISTDLGRPVHRRHMHELSEYLQPGVNHHVATGTTGLFVHIELNDRLTGNINQHREIAKHVQRAIQSGSGTTEIPQGRITIAEFDVTDSPLSIAHNDEWALRERVSKFVKARYGIDNQEVFIGYRPAKSAILIPVTSTRPSKFADGIYRQLKSAAEGQLSGSRSGNLVARISGVSAAELRSLGQDDHKDHEPPSALALIAGRLHNSNNRKHVQSTIYVCDDEFNSANTNQGATTVYNQPSAFYRFENPNHPGHGNPDYAIFSR